MKKLLLLLCVFVVSCKSDDPSEPKNPEFFFFNNTGVEIELVTYRNQRFDDKKFFIPAEKGRNLLVIGYDESVPKEMVPDGFPPLPYSVDYILVIYNNQDTIIHSLGVPESNSLFDENSYEFLILENVPTYDFIFSEEDYEAAKR